MQRSKEGSSLRRRTFKRAEKVCDLERFSVNVEKSLGLTNAKFPFNILPQIKISVQQLKKVFDSDEMMIKM
jgi:hypothetical protein